MRTFSFCRYVEDSRARIESDLKKLDTDFFPAYIRRIFNSALNSSALAASDNKLAAIIISSFPVTPCQVEASSSWLRRILAFFGILKRKRKVDINKATELINSLASSLDACLSVLEEAPQHQEEKETRELSTDILVGIQKLLGSIWRKDGWESTADYASQIEEVLASCGISVVHYSEGTKDAFVMASGPLRNVEVLPALADKSGVIISGKYFQ